MWLLLKISRISQGVDFWNAVSISKSHNDYLWLISGEKDKITLRW